MERLCQIDARLADQPGLLLAGAAYRGVGIPDCIREGEDAAQAAARYLEETKRLRD
jgi:oxygen-dependent protoporphyrinogen oxidase